MTLDNTSQPRSRIRRRLVTFALLFVFAIGYSAYDVFWAYPKTPHSGVGKEVAFTVERGVSPTVLVRQLSDVKVIASPGKFGLWLKLSGEFRQVKAGDFLLTDGMTPKEIVRTLQGRSINKGVRVTIPEGFTLSQMAQTMANAKLVTVDEFRKATFDADLLTKLNIPGPSAEGFLFPDTYYFDPSVTAAQIVKRMRENFFKKTLGLELPEGKPLLELVTLASIVQAEAKVADEAPIIAGVYRNRLTPDKFPSGRLQADPTVVYGCNPFMTSRAPSCLTFKGVLGSKQLQDDHNPYNTYRHAGLPPGPICAPGLHALSAAKSPAFVPYLYFVVSKEGRHQFSTTLAEHEKAVKAYREQGGQ
ncbi:MAG: endolytic transglycosylase MltG [Deltaproteobacteria bacterium]|nr:endolytic transglycosylase MltG [Deltaproteobacteria bacterium]